MASGLYPTIEIIERFLASVSTGNITQRFVAPCDLDVFGLALYVTTAPGASTTLTVNVSNYPTSQQGGSGTTVSAYNLWTATNVPSIVNTAQSNIVTTNSATLVKNTPYALNYPLPGPSGTVGYNTAQSTSTSTESPVTSPPTFYNYQMTNLVAPDNTYTDYNGVALSPASYVHAGDILTFVVGGSVGSAANLQMALYCGKR